MGSNRTKTPESESFAIRLLRAKKQMGFTQWELAKKAGVSQSTMARLEASQVLPSFDVLVRLAYQLGVSTDYLCGLTK